MTTGRVSAAVECRHCRDFATSGVSLLDVRLCLILSLRWITLPEDWLHSLLWGNIATSQSAWMLFSVETFEAINQQ
jgi:hypothetical protein